MAFLGKGTLKADLINLAQELGETVTSDLQVAKLRALILNSKEYEVEFVKARLETIVSMRIAQEKLEEQEKREEKETREREKREEREALERKEQEERNFELEKLRLEKSNGSNSELSLEDNEALKFSRVNFKKVMKEFEPGADIGLFLSDFERRASRYKIEKSQWVDQLTGLLPIELGQLISREPCEKAVDYDYVKSLLLKRFKLSPEKFRQKFVLEQRKSDSTWENFAYDLRNYLEEWLAGLSVTDFEKLKNLMVVDQMKRRVSSEIRAHFIDNWAKITSASKLAEMLDDYESVRGDSRSIPKNPCQERKKQEKNVKEVIKGKGNEEWKKQNTKREETFRYEKFERRRSPKCYECGSENHLRPQCPQRTSKTGVVNHVRHERAEDLLAPYTREARVNGYPLPVLRDSGATLDIVSENYVRPESYTGETVWVQQPLDEGPICLPLAKVELVGNFGRIETKAAVVRKALDKGRYILGNGTAERLELERGENKFFTCPVNAVETRLQKKRREAEKIENGDQIRGNEGEDQIQFSIDKHSTREDCEQSETNEETYELSEEERVDLPTVDRDSEMLLLDVKRQDLVEAQRESQSLKNIYESAPVEEGSTSKNKFVIKNELLMRRQEDSKGNVRHLVVVPEGLRDKVKALCHEGTSSHLGVTKTKDRLARYFFWPGCYKEVEDYVRSCDPCQKVGKSGDKKKAPLKLVPIIREVFTKLNIDTCGPLPATPSGKRYLLTVICVSSKYPDAVPLSDISSISITNALLTVFSRMGFPMEIQCDQGTSFMSALTSEFFEKFGIKVSHSSVHHPQSNPVERFHRTMKRLLKVICIEAGPDWEEHLSSVLFALRTVTHESTGFAPAELVFGKNLRSPETLIYEHWTEAREEEYPVTEYVLGLINRLKRCQDVAVEKMELSQIKRKFWYDRNAIKRQFKKGDLVLILATSRPNKLAPQWIGPGVIESKISETNYVVKITGKTSRSQIFHINMLKPYHKRPEIINQLSLEKTEEDMVDHEVEFPWLDPNPNIYDFEEVLKTSGLTERLDTKQISQLEAVLKKFISIFSNEPGLTNLVTHNIELIGNKPIRSKPYRLSQRQTEIMKTEIQRMLDLNIIEIGEFDFTSPMILVEAPGKDPRPCVDYRKLNEVIRTEYYPLPNIEERVELVSSAKYITILDLAKGYWQIPLSPTAQRLAAFVTTFGTYRPLRMPFGLKNAPFFFSKLMAEVLKGCENFAVPYLDDIAIFSENWEAHRKHLACVLDRIQKAKLTIKPLKCHFAQIQVKYLGHMVGQGFRKPAEAKIKAVSDFPIPKTKTEIRAFLGLAGYYSRYIPMFSVISAPLTDALKGKNKKGEITWNSDCEKSFQNLKTQLIQKPVLFAPNFKREFIVQTDSSDVGMGVVLTQLNDEGEEHPVLYLSKKFSQSEKKYSTTERECASIVFGVRKLHYYLDGQSFTVVTDHNPLVWLKKNAGSNPRLLRWALALQPYEFKVVHRSGKKNANADSLSRAPVQ